MQIYLQWYIYINILNIEIIIHKGRRYETVGMPDRPQNPHVILEMVESILSCMKGWILIQFGSKKENI